MRNSKGSKQPDVDRSASTSVLELCMVEPRGRWRPLLESPMSHSKQHSQQESRATLSTFQKPPSTSLLSLAPALEKRVRALGKQPLCKSTG